MASLGISSQLDPCHLFLLSLLECRIVSSAGIAAAGYVARIIGLEDSLKDKTTAGILALLLGGIGIHKFYLGRGGQGVLYLLFCWTFIPLIVSLIEGIILLLMSEVDFNLKYNTAHALVAAAASATSPQNLVVNVNSSASAVGQDVASQLKSLNELRVSGVLTDAEFYEQKQRLLNRDR